MTTPSARPPGPSRPGSPGTPAGGADPSTVNLLDWGILATGVLAFVFSFVEYYTFSSKGETYGGHTYGGGSVGESAWSGFFGWFAMLLALAGSAAVALRLFAPRVNLPVPARLAGVGAYAVSFVCIVLAFFVVPGYHGYDVPDSVDKGHGFGFWTSAAVILAGLAMSLMRFQATGGRLPAGLDKRVPNVGGYGPQGGADGPPTASGAPQAHQPPDPDEA